MRTEQQARAEDIQRWLATRLRMLYPGADAEVYQTHGHKLFRFLNETGLLGELPGSETFDIRVDFTGILREGNKVRLVFADCKGRPITLKDVGPMQAYSSVASPALSLIVSPFGMSESLNLLLNVYNRIDVLEYGNGRRVKIATWDVARKEVNPTSVIPPGELG